MLFLNIPPQRLDTGATPTFAGALFGDGTAAAPSVSFLSDPDTGFFRSGNGSSAFTSNGVASLGFNSGGSLTGMNAQGITMPGNGSIAIAATGTAQNITLTPSGSAFGVLSSGSVSYPATLNLARATVAGGAYLWSNQGANAEISAGFYYNGSAYVYAAAGAVSGIGFGDTNSGDIRFLQNAGGSVGATFTPTTVAMFKEGNGRFLLGTTTDSGALLQIGTNTTTSAGGMVFGDNLYLFRSASNQLTLNSTGGDVQLLFNRGGNTYAAIYADTVDSYIGSTTTIPFRIIANGGTAVTFSSARNATFNGTITPTLATTAGAPAYVKGAIYFDTTLNKLRVGGATAWETITSV